MAAIDENLNKPDTTPTLLGFSIGGSRQLQFCILAIGLLTSGCGFSIIQEHVFRIDGFVYGGWMTLLIYLSWILLSSIEGFTNRRKHNKRRATLQEYAIVALLVLAGVYCTNWSLVYLNYTTRIVVKSCRVLPVMIIRVLLQRKRYTLTDYAAACTLMCGICFFTLGDRISYPALNGTGLVLLAIALICDAMASNLEEKWFFSIPEPCSHSEVVHHLSIFASLYLIGILIVTEELAPAMRHSLENPIVIPAIITLSTFGFIGVEFALLMIQHFGATNTEVIKSMRRVFQVTLSFVIFPKPFTRQHGAGAIMVFLSLLWFEHGNKKRNSDS